MNTPKFFDVIIAHFAAHQLIAKKRRIADDDIAARPFAFRVKLERVTGGVFPGLRFLQCFRFAAEMRDEQRVFILEMLQLLEHGIVFVRKTVVAPPFQVPDLHGDLC